ncbi:hypothetical protein BpHYR1_008290 [Brachionus plicatilis]|uniref:Uncharacterized protein n=1 Tax=Brachionus plicatilis TaxID=10195 RepID=A0A3M7RZ91_BRAPC|nr:hypothetical protein BpHYR1_008290 [Brachionus plicatilis]
MHLPYLHILKNVFVSFVKLAGQSFTRTNKKKLNVYVFSLMGWPVVKNIINDKIRGNFDSTLFSRLLKDPLNQAVKLVS